MSKFHLPALFAAFLLASCSGITWDPTEKFGPMRGRDVGSGGAVFGGGKAQSEEFVAEEESTEASSPETRLYPGTGKFVAPRSPAPAGKPRAGDITLNFDNTDIREVVKIVLGDLLGLNYVISPEVNGSVSMETGRPLTREMLLPTLETLLRMNKAALVHDGNLYRVMPVGNAIRGAVVPQLGESARPLPRGFSVQIVPLRYIGVAEMQEILAPLAPEGSIIRADSLRNLLILAGSATEMASLLDTIEIFDVNWMKGLSVGLFRLEHSDISSVSSQLTTLLGSKDASPLAGLFRIIPVESANSLLVVTPQPSYLDEIRSWIERLDQSGTEGETVEQLYVYRVKHGDAEDLAGILSQLYSGKTASKSAAKVAPGLKVAKIESKDKKNTKDKSTAKTSGASSGSGMGTDASIVADTVNNSLLIRTTPSQYRAILSALQRLDILPLQVLVEATIVEVTLSGGLEYGLQWYLKGIVGNATNKVINTQSTDGGVEPGNLLNIIPGFNWSMVASGDAVEVLFSALASDNLVNVLSSPSVMVLDNHTASIQVGDEVPTISTQQQSTDTSSRVVNSIEYRETGVMLSVTPRVTPGGLVIMDIEQEVSNLSEQKVEGIDSPIVATRNISSSVAVKSNQAVVLGGLIQDERNENESGLPGLYKMPGWGWLFGSTKKSVDRKELVVVLTPRVIAGGEDINAVNEDFKRRLKGLEGRF